MYQEDRKKVDVAFVVNIPLEMRIKRIRYREEKRFGNSVLAEGDMHKQQVAFRNAVKNRDKKCLRSL